MFGVLKSILDVKDIGEETKGKNEDEPLDDDEFILQILAFNTEPGDDGHGHRLASVMKFYPFYHDLINVAIFFFRAWPGVP